MIKSACARALRCRIGPSSSGSTRASRARVRASRRSSFFRLSPIKRTLLACATITSCPNSFINRLIHGECVPVSSATRLCGIAPNTSLSAFGVVLTLRSKTTSPRSSSTQYQLQRSPRSNPTVYFFSAKLLACCLSTVKLFVIAGLLLYCASSALSLGAYRIPPGDRHSHPICEKQLEAAFVRAIRINSDTTGGSLLLGHLSQQLLRCLTQSLGK